MENQKITREECLNLIRQKYKEENKMPKKSDFSEYEVSMIKSFYGPWPRALEAAGVKAARTTDRKEINRQKHIRAKRRKREQLKN
ncbi:MAG: homing endonuclease associated repeat-containing protein [Eubacterium sp.]